MKRLLFKLLFIIVLMPISAHAMYENCIFSWQFGDANQSSLTIQPVGAICADRCKNECRAFSHTSYNGELNQDIIDSCITTCQSGQIFTSRYRISNPDTTAWYPYVWADSSVSTGSACSLNPSQEDSASYIYYAAGKNVNPGDKATITLFNAPNATGNSVYLCGMSTTILYPTIFSFDSGYWGSHGDKWFNHDTWNARNYNWTDTGINFKNGDYMKINVSWGFIWYKKISYDILAQPGNMLNGTALEIPQINEDGQQNITPEEAFKNNAKYKFLGLKNSVVQNVRSNVVIPGWSLQDNFQYRTVTYSGTVSGVSDNWSRLKIKHYDEGDSDHWGNNLGGLYVSITWRGCPYSDGERLQYAIVPVQSDKNNIKQYAPEKLPDSDWHDIPTSKVQNGDQITLEGQGPGALYLRIKPMKPDSSAPPNTYGPENSSGQYYISVDFTGSTASITAFVSQIINGIQSYLFGSTNNPGIVQKIFNAMVGESQWLQIIRALLTLYIAWTGLSYIIGVAKITQQDALIRLIKIGIVLALISPNSWSFFNTYLFNVFINGGLEIIADIVASTNASNEQIAQIQQDPAKVFSIFDTPFVQLFSSEVWLKILSILMSSLIGFILAIVLAFAVVTYLYCIGKAIIIYLISLIAIGLLLMLGPIFISFVLFEYTRKFFDAWLKQLLSFALQPIFAFGIIAILNQLLLLALHISLSFTTCKVCFFGIGIPTYKFICLIPGYSTLMMMHYPTSDFLGMPITQVGAILLFMILAQSTYVLLDYCAGIAGQIATSGGFLAANLSGVFDQQVSLARGLESVGQVTGTDRDSYQARDSITAPFQRGLQKAAISRSKQAQSNNAGNVGNAGNAGNPGNNTNNSGNNNG